MSFRQALNEAIGGSQTSQHSKGEAIDIDMDHRGGPENEEDMIELNLYYVACSRCRLELLNANHL